MERFTLICTRMPMEPFTTITIAMQAETPRMNTSTMPGWMHVSTMRRMCLKAARPPASLLSKAMTRVAISRRLGGGATRNTLRMTMPTVWRTI